jgi:Zn-dependent peptidase ImmA (M78 family)
MQKQIYAIINPKMLNWMRKTSNLTIEEITQKSKIKKAVLLEAEEKNSLLTIKQIRKLSQIYNRPLASFYLEELPEEKTLPDFRTKLNKKILMNRDLHSVLREHEDKKRFAEELFNLENIKTNYSYIGRFTEKDSNIEISEYIEKLLDLKRDELKNKTDNEVLNIWKEKIESIGILVFQFQKVNETITRGFSISKLPMPIIVINQKDTYYARVFTLIHELAHIVLNKTGLCDSNENITQISGIETKCNAIASLILVPKDEFNEKIEKYTNVEEDIKAVLDTLSKHFKVSWTVLLIRLQEEGLITQKTFLEHKNFLSLKKKKSKSPGGDYYRLLLSSTSKSYYKMVSSALRSEMITFYDAMNYLHVSYKVMKNLEERGDLGEI